MLDNPELLKALVEDDAKAEARFRPTPYWRLYANRIVQEVEHSGLENFRTNQKILKGFGWGGVLRPTLPASPFKRAAWSALVGIPGVNRIIGEYERLLTAQQFHTRRVEASLARQVIERIAGKFPNLKIPDGVTAGGADDPFDWRGQKLSSDFVLYLSRAADFYGAVDPSNVRWIVEIGPGVGLSTLAHVALNPNLQGVVNADIVPVIYVSTQFLKQSASIEVVDYLAVRGDKAIDVAPGVKPRVYSLPAWMLPRVQGHFDYGFNAFSFQEMEEDVCAAYARDLLRVLGSGMMLHSSIQGHKAGAGGQAQPVTMAFLKRQFSGVFPRETEVDGLFCEAYGGRPAGTILLQKRA